MFIRDRHCDKVQHATDPLGVGLPHSPRGIRRLHRAAASRIVTTSSVVDYLSEISGADHLKLPRWIRPYRSSRLASRSRPYCCHVTWSTPTAAFGLIARYAARRRSTLTWCNNDVNCVLLSLRAAWRTRSSPFDVPVPPLCAGRVALSAFPLGSPLPSTASATGRPALFGSFAGTTGLSDFP